LFDAPAVDYLHAAVDGLASTQKPPKPIAIRVSVDVAAR
jgi:hypothetical protein